MSDAVASNPAPGKRRPRFSLLNLLLLMAIIGMGITIATLWGEVAPLRTENRRLRDELGEITITDRTKLHAIRVPNQGEFVWKWRVWLPSGGRYLVRSEGGPLRVTKSGYPAYGGSMAVAAAAAGEEVWVEYRITKNANGEWRGATRTSTGSVGSDVHDWVPNRRKVSTTDGVGSTTKVGEPGERLLLARFRTADAGSSADIPDPADGFIIWIEPR